MNALSPVARFEADQRDTLAYLHAHYRETIFALHDLLHLSGLAHGQRPDVFAYAREGRIVAVQCLYSGGRWLPHWSDPSAQPILLEDALHRSIHWAVGCRRVMDPLLETLAGRGRRPSYDQVEVLCAVDAAHLSPRPAPATVRRATLADASQVAELRVAFEAEYFGTPVTAARGALYLAAAERSIQDGTWLAEIDGLAVAAASVEADIPELAHIAAVYTRPPWRGRGLAKGLVSAICQEILRVRPRATLTVRADNVPAWRAYRAIGFTPWDEYRMCQL